jgi:hypothetical protein
MRTAALSTPKIQERSTADPMRIFRAALTGLDCRRRGAQHCRLRPTVSKAVGHFALKVLPTAPLSGPSGPAFAL